MYCSSFRVIFVVGNKSNYIMLKYTKMFSNIKKLQHNSVKYYVYDTLAVDKILNRLNKRWSPYISMSYSTDIHTQTTNLLILFIKDLSFLSFEENCSCLALAKFRYSWSNESIESRLSLSLLYRDKFY